MSTPESKADRLTAALRDNTHALNHVRSRYRWSFVLTALVALSLLFSVYSNHESDVELCENNNAVRADIDTKFESLGDFLARTSDSTRTNEFVELVQQDIPIRDCSNIGWFG